MSKKRAGDRGEELALRYLSARGYTLLRRNYRTRHGELDLIMRRGGIIVFVEVKLRGIARRACGRCGSGARVR